MTSDPSAVLLVGSAKRGASTSGALGDSLAEGLARRGWSAKRILLHEALASEERASVFAASLEGADLLVLSTPLYVDALPALATRALELIARRQRERPAERAGAFAAIVNCGFPEASQCATALEICRLFALEAGLSWAGGLAMGGGESIHGRPLEKARGPARHALKALDAAAEALARGGAVPPEAVAVMARPVVPAWLYTLLGGWGWKRQAREHGAESRLMSRPYEPCGNRRHDS